MFNANDNANLNYDVRDTILFFSVARYLLTKYVVALLRAKDER